MRKLARARFAPWPAPGPSVAWVSGPVLLVAVLVAWLPPPFLLGGVRAQAFETPSPGGVPYVPTPWPVVKAMLDLAKVGPDDFVVDLGSGDGRVVIEAARSLGARGLGVELDPDLVRLSQDEARRLGVGTRATFERRDLFETDLSLASVVTLYLLPRLLLELQPRLLRLRAGTRIVSHDFPLGDWKPDATVTVDVADRGFGPPYSTLYLWVVPAFVDGTWEGEFDHRGRAESYRLELRQHFQALAGSVRVGGRTGPLEQATLSGDRLRVSAIIEGASGRMRHVFEGRSVSGELVGTWTATALRAAAGPGTVASGGAATVARRVAPASGVRRPR
jgi:SAM-dependent methyltransferase